jgi:hypothetical protein
MPVSKKLINNYMSLDDADRMWREVPDLDRCVVVRSYRACGCTTTDPTPSTLLRYLRPDRRRQRARSSKSTPRSSAESST